MWRLLISTIVFSSIIFTSNVFANPLSESINKPHRADSAERDRYRHPSETLSFFNIEPTMSVLEVWPGAGGWYTEILAPYLHDKGTFFAAQFNADSTAAYYRNSRAKFEEKMKATPALYSKVKITTFNPPKYVDIAPAGSLDRVLTFRNIHNWYMRGGGDERVLAAFKAFHKALKPGGVLGVVEHRLPANRPETDQEASGYMHEAYVIKQAERAGFKLLAKSEINSNPADTTLHPKGVWTLPPSLRLGEEDSAKYLAIGESDRMTLKFIKVAD